MKIIKYGEDIKAWKLDITCHYCKSDLEVCADDLRYSGEAGDWHDLGWERYEIACGACGAAIDIVGTAIPNLVKIHAQKKKAK